MGKRIEQINSRDLEAIIEYHWPGNIRELKNLVEKSLIQCTGSVLRFQIPQEESHQSNGFLSLDEMQKQHILKALNQTRQVISGEKGAARLLGINPKTLWSRMKKLGIKQQKYPEM